MQEKIITNELANVDIIEDDILTQMPEILKILLLDRTRSNNETQTRHNIIWANDNYIEYDEYDYAPTAPIQPRLITGRQGKLIQPRVLKTAELQKKRTRTKAEVFTPAWVVKKQNDAVDETFAGDSLEEYLSRTWLEISCGEAPYMTTRYDMGTGIIIPLADRVGFVDRKMARLNREIDDQAEWLRLAQIAYQACYGFEWNGDSLLLARENLLYTYRDYHSAKWSTPPTVESFEQIARIISYNVFQMDGLTKTIPFSEFKEQVDENPKNLFNYDEPDTDDPLEDTRSASPAVRVQIMNWQTNKMEDFG